MKVCQFCGAENPDSVAVCSSCGANKFQYKCDNCGTVFGNGKYCPNCGVKVGTKAKKCPRCGTNYYSSACPDCGYRAVSDKAAVAKNGATIETTKKKKIWLWVFGWLLIFPLPLTILIVRKKNLNKKAKIGIIIAAWILYFALASFGKSPDHADTSKISMISSTDSTKSSSIDSMKFSSDDSLKSDASHVAVSEPIKVEAVNLTAAKSELAIGEKLQINASISPAEAEDQKLTWTSSDNQVATVDEEGNVTAMSGGKCTICATVAGGASSTVAVSVDGTKALMHLYVQHRQENDVHIGNEWSYSFQLNGEPAKNEVALTVGDSLSLYAQLTEDDKQPDVGEASLTHVVTEEDVANGFEEKLDVYVTENGGKNRGKTAYFIVAYTFEPLEK